MNAPISGRLKATFLIHAIVGLILGLGYLFIPVQVGEWFGLALDGGVFERMVGAAILSFGLSSALAYVQTRFESVKLLVQLEIIWTLLATILLVWAAFNIDQFPNMIADELSTARMWIWFDTILMALFFLAFGGFYLFDQRRDTQSSYAGSEA